MRTAICLTGQSRTFGTSIAESIHKNIYSVLEKHGFDIFLIQPGPVRHPTMGLISQWTGNASLLEPRSTNQQGIPNRMFKISQGEQHNLPYMDDQRWSNYFLIKRTHHHLHKQIYIQNLLHMAYDQYLCHNLTLSEGKYTAKIRMRPDMLFKSKMPWALPLPGMILAPSKLRSTEDQFAFGTANDMNVYLSRYPLYHSASEYALTTWTTESFLNFCLASRNISIRQDPHFITTLLRTKNFSRLVPCTTELYNQ